MSGWKCPQCSRTNTALEPVCSRCGFARYGIGTAWGFVPSDLEFFAVPEPKVGGMHVGLGGTGVRVLHRPSKISVTCESERSQHHNRNHALTALRAAVDAINEAKKGGA